MNVSQLREVLLQNCRQVTRYLGMGEAEVKLLSGPRGLSWRGAKKLLAR